MNVAGTPPYNALSLSRLPFTTDPAATIHPFATLAPGRMITFAAIHVPSPILTEL